MKKYVLIVAGGSGMRMGTEVPKQFLEVHGKPIIIYTIQKFLNVVPEAEIVVVLPETEMGQWDHIAGRYELKGIAVAKGGANRFESVKSGLGHIAEGGLVAIHDGVRPLVSESTISAVYKEAEKSGACVPVIKLRQSARIITETKSEAIDRNNLRIVQTPQCFHSTLIKKAYRSSYQPHFTDDATVLESTGQQVSLIEGNVENIKITFQSDLKIAESLLDNI